MHDNLSTRGKALFAAGLVLIALGAGVGFFHPDASQTNYQYSVKSEQIETDAGYSGNATSIDNLPEAQQDAIFRAYKKSDHFLGGSSAYVETDEPLNLTKDDRWRAVEIEGARVLVGIGGPERVDRLTALGEASMGAMLVGFVVAMLAIMIGAHPSNRRGY